MKKIYVKPTMSTVKYMCEDIITTSSDTPAKIALTGDNDSTYVSLGALTYSDEFFAS